MYLSNRELEIKEVVESNIIVKRKYNVFFIKTQKF